MTTSAIPFRRSSSESVLRSDGSQTTRAGQWNAPTTFLAPGKVDRRLAADAGVDLAHEGRRDGRPRHSSHVGRRGEAHHVRRGAAAERDERPVAADPERRPEPLEHRGRLRRLAGGHLVLFDVPGPERDLRPDAVDPRDVGVGDELDRPVAGHELAELVDRAQLDVDACGCEEDVVHVARVRVGDSLVERLAVAVQRMKLVLRLRERPSTACDTLPGGLRVDVEQHRERAAREVVPRPLGEDGAPTERDDDRLAAAQHVPRDVLLERPEARFAAGREQLGDRRPRPRLDLPVEVDEAPAETGRHDLADTRLPRAHEPGERQVAAERVRRAHAASPASSASRSHGTSRQRSSSGA